MRQPLRLSDIVFLDLEASGLGDRCFPIEIGFIRAHDLSGWSALIRPADRWRKRGTWDHRAEALHGLDRETLESDGQDVRDVARTLNDNLAGKAVFSDAVEFDSHWLGMLFEETMERPAFDLQSVDPLFRSPDLFADLPIMSQHPADTPLQKHRAKDDAMALALQFRQQIK
ncbi:hypothetical protein [Telmatospirillum siberiense]|nr:hypothetical protein [Telmatospirillum siberiense]